jgi:hypothetical protein
MKGITGNPLAVYGKADIYFVSSVTGGVLPQTCYVVDIDQDYQFMGGNVIGRKDIPVNALYSCNVLQIGSEYFPIEWIPGIRIARAWLMDNMVIAPHSECVLRAKVDCTRWVAERESGLLTPSPVYQNKKGINIASALVIPNSKGVIQCRIANPTDKVVSIKQREDIGYLEPCFELLEEDPFQTPEDPMDGFSRALDKLTKPVFALREEPLLERPVKSEREEVHWVDSSYEPVHLAKNQSQVLAEEYHGESWSQAVKIDPDLPGLEQDELVPIMSNRGK